MKIKHVLKYQGFQSYMLTIKYISTPKETLELSWTVHLLIIFFGSTTVCLHRQQRQCHKQSRKSAGKSLEQFISKHTNLEAHLGPCETSMMHLWHFKLGICSRSLRNKHLMMLFWFLYYRSQTILTFAQVSLAQLTSLFCKMFSRERTVLHQIKPL